MTDLLTAAQMRAIEEAAIASGSVTGLELMERAGRGVVEAIFEEWPELAKAPHRAVVLCGPGNNGGDGFVVARLLKDQGWEIDVFLYGDADKLPPDARVNYERWREMGEVGTLDLPKPTKQQIDALTRAASHLHDLQDQKVDASVSPFVVVDALFGIGLSRPLIGIEDLISHWDYLTNFNDLNDARVVAVDVPSGLDSDSGRGVSEDATQGLAVLTADLTVTFHATKLGHVLGEGARASGKIRTVSIGLDRDKPGASAPVRPRPAPQGGGESAPTLGPGANIVTLVTRPENLAKLGRHKFQSGHALILSGGPGRTGAARLAARGALRVGAGLVTVGCPRQALAEVAGQVTAIMCKPLDGVPGLREVLEDKRLNSLCLGPGMGLGPDTQAMVLEALAAERSTVLDADALTRFERNPDVLFEALHERCVLTPHEGEFGRLFPDIKEKLDAIPTKGPAYSKVDATRDAAKRAGCVVLFKGPDTVIAAPDGRCAINASVYERAAPWLATAGSGDVLAGFITGLLSRGFSPYIAACMGAWLHTECALSFGPGLIAEDLPEEVPKVFRNIGL